MLVNEVVECLVVLLVVVVELLHVQIALADFLQTLVVSLLNLLVLYSHEELVKSLLLLDESDLESLSLLLNHAQFLVVVWQEVLQEDLLNLYPCLVLVYVCSIKDGCGGQIILVKIEVLIGREQCHKWYGNTWVLWEDARHLGGLRTESVKDGLVL